LANAIIGLAGERKRETVLSRRLKDLDGYDYVILDSSPHDGVMEENVIHYADLLIIPTLGKIGIRDVLNS
jgi:cellulose biosynthesis protein BcsQ